MVRKFGVYEQFLKWKVGRISLVGGKVTTNLSSKCLVGLNLQVFTGVFEGYNRVNNHWHIWGRHRSAHTEQKSWKTSTYTPKIPQRLTFWTQKWSFGRCCSFSNGWCFRFHVIFRGSKVLVRATLPFKQLRAFLYDFCSTYHKNSLEKAISPALKYPHVEQNSWNPRFT